MFSDYKSYYIQPNAIGFSTPAEGNGFVLASVVSGAKLRLSGQVKTTNPAYPHGIIGYQANLSYRDWTIQGGLIELGSTLQSAEDLHCYLRLDASPNGNTGIVIFSDLDIDIDGFYTAQAESGADTPVPDGSAVGEDSQSQFGSYQYFYINIGTFPLLDGTRTFDGFYSTGELTTDKGQEEHSTGEWARMFQLNATGTQILAILPFLNIIISGYLKLKEVTISSILTAASSLEDWASENHLATTAAIAKYIAATLEGLNDKYLRKDQPDKTDFGLEMKSATINDSAVIGKNLSVGGSVSASSAQVKHEVIVGDHLTMGKESDFQEGTAGCKLYHDGSGWHVQTDYLTVTKKARFKEVEISKVTHIGGEQLLTAARCIADYVILYNNTYYVFFLKKDSDGHTITNDWKVNDQAYCQTFNLEEGISTAESGEWLGNRYYWRLVTGTSNDDVKPILPPLLPFDISEYNYILLSNNKKDNPSSNPSSPCAVDAYSDVPTPGDAIVQLGYQGNDDPDRQGATLLSGAGIYRQSLIMWEAIKTFALPKYKILLSPRNVDITADSISFKTKGGSTTNIEDYLNSIEAVDGFEIWHQTDDSDPYEPTLATEPARTWLAKNTAANHVGDYYINKDGIVWKFERDGDTFVWQLVTDKYLLTTQKEISNILSDDVITNDEKRTISEKSQVFAKDYAHLEATCASRDLIGTNVETNEPYEDAKFTAYKQAYSRIQSIFNYILQQATDVNLPIPGSVLGDTISEPITRTYITSAIVTYYDAKEKLSTRITESYLEETDGGLADRLNAILDNNNVADNEKISLTLWMEDITAQKNYLASKMKASTELAMYMPQYTALSDAISSILEVPGTVHLKTSANDGDVPYTREDINSLFSAWSTAYSTCVEYLANKYTDDVTNEMKDPSCITPDEKILLKHNYLNYTDRNSQVLSRALSLLEKLSDMEDEGEINLSDLRRAMNTFASFLADIFTPTFSYVLNEDTWSKTIKFGSGSATDVIYWSLTYGEYTGRAAFEAILQAYFTLYNNLVSSCDTITSDYAAKLAVLDVRENISTIVENTIQEEIDEAAENAVNKTLGTQFEEVSSQLEAHDKSIKATTEWIGTDFASAAGLKTYLDNAFVGTAYMEFVQARDADDNLLYVPQRQRTDNDGNALWFALKDGKRTGEFTTTDTGDANKVWVGDYNQEPKPYNESTGYIFPYMIPADTQYSGLVTKKGFASLFAEAVAANGKLLAAAEMSASVDKEIARLGGAGVELSTNVVNMIISNQPEDNKRLEYGTKSDGSVDTTLVHDLINGLWYTLGEPTGNLQYYYKWSSKATMSADQVFIQSGSKALGNYFSLNGATGDVTMHDLTAHNITLSGIINQFLQTIDNEETFASILIPMPYDLDGDEKWRFLTQEDFYDGHTWQDIKAENNVYDAQHPIGTADIPKTVKAVSPYFGGNMSMPNIDDGLHSGRPPMYVSLDMAQADGMIRISWLTKAYKKVLSSWQKQTDTYAYCVMLPYMSMIDFANESDESQNISQGYRNLQYVRTPTTMNTGALHYITIDEIRSLVGRRIVIVNDTPNGMWVMHSYEMESGDLYIYPGESRIFDFVCEQGERISGSFPAIGVLDSSLTYDTYAPRYYWKLLESSNMLDLRSDQNNNYQEFDI